MKKVIIAPDSFKGNLSAVTICGIISEHVEKYFPDSKIIKVPIADGGEGTVECFLESSGGRTVHIRAAGPYFNEIDSFYGILPDGVTAVIEMAAAAGLPLAGARPDPSVTTTFGLGMLISDALEKGCRKIIVGLGGSSTNDCGAGMAAALGVRFLDGHDQSFIPTGSTLDRVKKIDMSGRNRLLETCEVISATDVDNPLYGKNGAAYVYGPQKGADEAMVKLLDDNLRRFASVIRECIGKDLGDIPGAGAAGGLGAGMIAFAGSELRSGIDLILETAGFDELLDDTDLVITGEGRIDGQSLRGKAVIGVARAASERGVPVIVIAGDIGDDIEGIYRSGVTAVMSINRVAVPFAEARKRSESDLALTVDTLMRIIKSMS